jgi:hypothetical protein
VASVRAAAAATAVRRLGRAVLRVWPAQSVGQRSVGFTAGGLLPLLLRWWRRTQEPDVSNKRASPRERCGENRSHDHHELKEDGEIARGAVSLDRSAVKRQADSASRRPLRLQRQHNETLEGAERERAWNEITSLAPGYGRYQENTDRIMPIIRLKAQEEQR